MTLKLLTYLAFKMVPLASLLSMSKISANVDFALAPLLKILLFSINERYVGAKKKSPLRVRKCLKRHFHDNKSTLFTAQIFSLGCC